MSRVRIAFASTNYGPLWMPAVTSWLRVVAHTQRALLESGQGQLGAVGITDRMYTHSAGNKLVEELLADASLSHLFLTESDMILPDEAITRLLALDQPIASGVYFLRGGAGQPCLYTRMIAMPQETYGMTPVTVFPQDRPFRLRGCPGLGCLLIRREVFEQVPYPWFDLAEGKYGSDLYFFTNVAKQGIPVWVDPAVRCGQIEYRMWTYADYEQRLKEDPGFAGQGFLLAHPPASDLWPAEGGA